MSESASLWSHPWSSLFIANAIVLVGFHHNDKTHMRTHGSKTPIKEGRIYFNHYLERQD
jgi:hypothetical protein